LENKLREKILNFIQKLFCVIGNVKLKIIVAFVLQSLITVQAYAEPGEFSFNLDISMQSDSNVNQAKLDTDSVEDTITSESLNLSYQQELNILSAFSLTAGIAGKQYKEVSTQNSASGLLGVSFMWQNAMGYRAPFYQLSVNSEFQNNESFQQDSTIINYQFIISSRLSDIITGTLGFGHKDRDSESTVYDLSDSRIFTSFDYLLNKRATLYGTFIYITGDTFSIARPDTDAERYIALSAGKENIQWDQAFNEAFPSQVTQWQAYRIKADSQVFVFGYNYGFGHGNSVDLSFTRADVSGDAGAEYQRDIINASLLKRF
jgi:hypothetical protein